MRNRSGVSLVEVIVASVLLSVGVAGCVAALLGSARLRARAAATEAVADAVERRLSWLETAGCSANDSTIRVDGVVEERWALARDSLAARLEGHAWQRLSVGQARLALRIFVECR